MHLSLTCSYNWRRDQQYWKIKNFRENSTKREKQKKNDDQLKIAKETL